MPVAYSAGLATRSRNTSDGKEVVPGIKAIATPGHTPGHMSYLVSSGPQNLIVQSDITAGMAFLFVKNPDWQLMFDMDKPLAVQSRKRIYDQAVADKTLVHGFHLPFPGARIYGEGRERIPVRARNMEYGHLDFSAQ